ncbi:tropinone reductase homolog At5g06060 [Nicotiana tabacum]|uniref:Tropinone reductase homolog At5g06060 n=1 Tax=Nicotiana tabacum TaxID=4097 RepID=A0A1S4AKQ4_TOBAC|nr:tropinone reductase homolog At5g06060-like [Nicotiana tomentosiformis]XP_016477280.1 PREDICTED: tropinone reductase homolog At5g06060-like [Nicotiana tabacum]
MATEQEQSSSSNKLQKWSLYGKTALVTGGTRGIGFAIVEELAGFGATIHTCSRNQKELDEKIQEWKGKGFKVTGSVCDLYIKEEREQLIQTVSSVFEGKLDILVNNAAISMIKRAADISAEDYSKIMGTNVESPFHLTQIAYPLLKASGNAASIVFISSLAGSVALPALSVYGASKGAINQLTKFLACEWASDGIRVNTVSPFAVKTNILKPEDIDPSLLGNYSELMCRTPLKPIAEADEISPVVAFLCLPAASHITGQIIHVDGGFSAGSFKFQS